MTKPQDPLIGVRVALEQMRQAFVKLGVSISNANDVILSGNDHEHVTKRMAQDPGTVYFLDNEPLKSPVYRMQTSGGVPALAVSIDDQALLIIEASSRIRAVEAVSFEELMDGLFQQLNGELSNED